MAQHSPSSAAPQVEERRASRWEPFWHDIRYAARGLRRKPAFTAAVVLTLGLGIGANATMFSIVDRLMFRPPAYLASPNLVHRMYVGETSSLRGEYLTSNISYKLYLEVTEWARTLDRTAAFFEPELAIGTGEGAREMRIGAVSASFWSFFDISPVIGRFFTPDEDRTPDGTRVAVLAHGYWQANYGGRRDVLGKSLAIGSRTYTIVGVTPPGFLGVATVEPAVFVPITASAVDLFGGNVMINRGGGPRPTYYGSHNMSWMEMLVRRKPGVSASAVTADLTSAYRRSYLEQLALDTDMRPIELARPRAVAAPVLSERGPNQGNQSKVAVWLVGVAGIVLLIACANVGNLLLARAFSRRREIAVRLALGVTRARFLRQLITESLLLAALGALAAIGFAQWGGDVLRAVLLENTQAKSVLTDTRVLLFTAVAAIVAGLLTGLAPALHAGRGDIAGTLKAGAREGTYHRSRTRLGLLVLQGALSVVLLIGAGLFVRSLRKVQTLDLGYDSARVALVSVQMRGTPQVGAAPAILRRQLLERAQQLPFVEKASRVVGVPFYMNIVQDLYVAGIDSVGRLGRFYYHAVSPDYFATMGTSIRRGRGFTTTDTEGSQRVMVVSESMAAKLWPGKDAIGKCAKIGEDTMPCTDVVGITQDIKRGSLSDDPGLQYYVPIEQADRGGGLFVRTRGEAAPFAEQLRKELQKSMPGVSYVTITPLSRILGSEMASWKLGATMFTVFGALALLVAAVGLYSVIAYNVAQRSHELGVRLALGAQTGDVTRLIVGEGAWMAMAGIVIGGGIALAAGPFVAPLLFGISPRDPAVYIIVTVTLLVVALAASVFPALRAARIDPNVALRAD